MSAELARREARFSQEREAFALRFRCAACAHVISETGACSMGYPNRLLRGPVIGVQPDGLPVTCKYFELGEREHEDP